MIDPINTLMTEAGMNPDLNRLQPYPFEKLTALKAQVTPPQNLEPIALSIGEPRHPAPEFVLNSLRHNLNRISNYPSTKGLPELREAIAHWCQRRFILKPETLTAEDHVLPVNGTREAIFAFTQALVARKPGALVASPNPFYQIYEGAAYLAGAEPYFMPCLAENGFIPDFDAVSEDVWQNTQLLFLCTPGNPTGAVMSLEVLKKLIALSDQYDFVIASDECYSEIYFDEQTPPPGLLQACAELGRDDYKNCVVFHSLSKRSNLPGLRSGFIAGEAELMQKFLLFRTYHGSSMPVQHQLASIAAWNDEDHTIANRAIYAEKFERVGEILKPVLNFEQPEASFYLWPETPIDEELFAQQLFAQQNVTVLPGSYLSRTINGLNPGKNRVRMALVATTDECVEAAQRIRRFVDTI